MDRFFPLISAILLTALTIVTGGPLLISIPILAATLAWALLLPPPPVEVPSPVPAPNPPEPVIRHGLQKALEAIEKTISNRDPGYSLADVNVFLVIGKAKVGKTSLCDELVYGSNPASGSHPVGLSWRYVSASKQLLLEVPNAIFSLEGSTNDYPEELVEALRRAQGGRPLTGVVLVLNAMDYSKEGAFTEQDGCTLAARLEPFAGANGRNCNVCVVVTRCDRVDTFVEASEHLDLLHLGDWIPDAESPTQVMESACLRVGARALKVIEEATSTEKTRQLLLAFSAQFGRLVSVFKNGMKGFAGARPGIRLVGVYFGYGCVPASRETRRSFFAEDLVGKVKDTPPLNEAQGRFFRGLLASVEVPPTPPKKPSSSTSSLSTPSATTRPSYWSSGRSQALLWSASVGAILSLSLGLAAVVANRNAAASIELTMEVTQRSHDGVPPVVETLARLETVRPTLVEQRRVEKLGHRGALWIWNGVGSLGKRLERFYYRLFLEQVLIPMIRHAGEIVQGWTSGNEVSEAQEIAAEAYRELPSLLASHAGSSPDEDPRVEDETVEKIVDPWAAFMADSGALPTDAARQAMAANARLFMVLVARGEALTVPVDRGVSSKADDIVSAVQAGGNAGSVQGGESQITSE